MKTKFEIMRANRNVYAERIENKIKLDAIAEQESLQRAIEDAQSKYERKILREYERIHGASGMRTTVLCQNNAYSQLEPARFGGSWFPF